MKFCTLFSGSSGNCIYIEDNGVKILVDAGKNLKAITNSLKNINVDIKDINAILITHDHSDHISAVGTIAKHYDMPIIGRRDTLEYICEKNSDLMPDRFTVLEGEGTFDVCGIGVTPFQTPHDSRDSVGYTFVGTGGRKLAIATDLGKVTEVVFTNLLNSHFIIIESNHDLEMLNNGNYPWFLKKRVASDRGHLSNNDCAKTICSLVKKGCEHFVLAHISENNNTEKLANNTISLILLNRGIKPPQVTVDIAPRHINSTVFEF